MNSWVNDTAVYVYITSVNCHHINLCVNQIHTHGNTSWNHLFFVCFTSNMLQVFGNTLFRVPALCQNHVPCSSYTTMLPFLTEYTNQHHEPIYWSIRCWLYLVTNACTNKSNKTKSIWCKFEITSFWLRLYFS